MPSKIALFPLGLVAFPTENVNLHIFEPRYRKLVEDCKTHGITFGIVPYANQRIQSFGTEMKLLSIEKVYPDGKMDIKTKGIQIIRVEEFYNKLDGNLYPGGTIEALPNSIIGSKIKKGKLLQLLRDFYKVMKLKDQLPDIEVFTSYSLAHKIGLSYEQEYQLLQILDEDERLDFLINHVTKIIPLAQQMEEMKRKIKLNGHFKNIIPPSL